MSVLLNMFSSKSLSIPKSNKGIYGIVCKANGKFYLGSSVDLKRRKFWHFCKLRRGEHNNPYLQNAFKKYSNEAFEFRILESLPSSATFEEVLKREQFYLDKLRPWDSEIGYNICKVAGRPSCRQGFRHKPETIRLFSEQRRGKPKSDSFKKLLSKAFKGKTMQERTGNINWTCNKKGKTMKEITGNLNWEDPKTGRKHKPSSIKKMSKRKTGPNNPSFCPELVTLFNKKQQKFEKKTRYEWRNEYGVEVSKLISGHLKTSRGWALQKD